MERGDFDNLPGKGKPLNLAEDPLLDPMTALVNRILRDNGLPHPLIEARKDITAEAQKLRSELARAWLEYQRLKSEEGWQDAVRTFRARVKEFNREVGIFNLKSPSPVFHGLALDPDAEIAQISSSNPLHGFTST